MEFSVGHVLQRETNILFKNLEIIKESGRCFAAITVFLLDKIYKRVFLEHTWNLDVCKGLLVSLHLVDGVIKRRK